MRHLLAAALLISVSSSAADFRAFSNAGRELGQWHLGYETVEPYPLEEDYNRLVMEDSDWRVHKMVFGKRGGDSHYACLGGH